MKLFVLVFALLLTGCTTFDAAVHRGADTYDEALAVGEGVVCRAGSVRSVIDRYARDTETWKAWLHLCGYVRFGIEKPEPVQ